MCNNIMEIVGGVKYNHVKEDCPIVLSMALRKKYKKLPKLSVMMPDHSLLSKINKGLDHYGCKLNQIYESHTNFIDKQAIVDLLQYLLENKKDGFFVLEHNNPIETRHLLGFLYNYKHNTLDFFDSYNPKRIFYTMRMKPTETLKFIYDVFHKYFKDEFVIEKLYEIDFQ